MNDSVVTLIENFRIWSSGNWVKCTVKTPLLLRIHYDQLLITSDDKVLESLNTNKKLKGIIKDDILILIINADGKEVRKIKFQIKENIQQCLQELKARFPVVSYGSVANKCTITTKYDNIEDIFQSFMDDKGCLALNLLKSVKFNALAMPENYKNFVKLCLLDPMFPQLVHKTKQILETEVLNKQSQI